jgi:hypothetical protein
MVPRVGLLPVGVLVVAVAAAFFLVTSDQSGGSDAAPKLLFLAPFWSGGGYASEATILAIYLEQQLEGQVRVRHHGDMAKDSFVASLSADKRGPLQRMLLTEHDNDWLVQNQRTITICHSSAHAWDAGGHTSEWPDITAAKCPVPGDFNTYTIGRTMLEGSPLPAKFAQRVNALDEIWVPSLHQKRVFEESGVDPQKLIHIPESADWRMFDPGLVSETDAELTELTATTKGCVFLSVFKAEERKGWKTTLSTFIAEFDASDDVELVIVSDGFLTRDQVCATQCRLLIECRLSDSGSGMCYTV